MNVRRTEFLIEYRKIGGKISNQDKHLLNGFGWGIQKRAKNRWCVHRQSCASGQKGYSLHRKIMSLMIKRELESNEIVIHLDGDYLNNRRSNLKLLSNKSI